MVEDEVKERISKMTDVEGLHVPHAPLTNGVFLQQNQFLPKIYGSMQISAGNHCHLSFLSNWSSFLQRSDSSSSSKSENVNDNDVNGWVQSGTTFNLYFLYYTFPLLRLQDQMFVFPKLQQIVFPLSWQDPIWLFQYLTFWLFLILHTFLFSNHEIGSRFLSLCPYKGQWRSTKDKYEDLVIFAWKVGFSVILVRSLCSNVWFGILILKANGPPSLPNPFQFFHLHWKHLVCLIS